MSERDEADFVDEEEKLYLALEQVLKEMSHSTRPQRKLADELVTLLQNHYEVYGYLQSIPSGQVEVSFERR